MESKLDDALAVVERFSRCMNYPKSGSEMTKLAQGLIRASEMTGVLMEEIAQRCAEETEHCPTDALMLRAAKALKPYVSPRSDPYSQSSMCEACGGTGWQILHALHTNSHRKDGSFYVEKEWISEKQANDLMAKIDTQKQMVYSCARRCACGKSPAADRSLAAPAKKREAK